MTLEQCWDAALKYCPLAQDREHSKNSERSMINTHHTVGATRCGSFHHWVDGENQLVVEKTPNSTTWKISEVPPPQNSGGAKCDFLPHSLYFGIRGNHAVLVQSQGLRHSSFSDYLNWLFYDKCQLTPLNQSVLFNPASATRLRQKGVHKAKSITIQKHVGKKSKSVSTQGNTYHRIIDKQISKGLLSALRALGIAIPAGLEHDDDLKDLRVTLQISARRGANALDNSAMCALSRLVADQTSDDYQLNLADGGVLKGDDLILKTDAKFAVPLGRTHPNEYDIFKELDAYLQRLITAGTV